MAKKQDQVNDISQESPKVKLLTKRSIITLS